MQCNRARVLPLSQRVIALHWTRITLQTDCTPGQTRSVNSLSIVNELRIKTKVSVPIKQL